MGKYQRDITNCSKGHPFSTDNTIFKASGFRECRTCKRERDLNRASRAKRPPWSLDAFIDARLSPNELTGCLEWTGALSRYGYGTVKLPTGSKPSTLSAHRANYVRKRGPIPDGLHLDHLCRNPKCCNPDHLEPVTQRENTLRGTSPPARQARQTHCKRGHELAGDNLSIRSNGGRVCRACSRLGRGTKDNDHV